MAVGREISRELARDGFDALDRTLLETAAREIGFHVTTDFLPSFCTDLRIDAEGVERAWQRAEASKVDEERVYMSGRLIGVIPIHRRFEFQPDGASMIFGTVGEDFGQSILQRMVTEQFIGKRWRGFFHKKLVERAGRPPVDRYTLLRLEDENSEPQTGPLDQAIHQN